MTEEQAYEAFDQYINEITDSITIMGINIDPAEALKEYDPTAYNVAFADWTAAEGIKVR